MLATRIKTSVFLLALIIAMVLVVPAAVRLVFFALIGLWSTLEWSALVSQQRAKRAAFIGFVVAVYVLALLLEVQGVSLDYWLLAGCVFWLWVTTRLLRAPLSMSTLERWVGGVAVLVPAALGVTLLLTRLTVWRGGCLLLLVWATVAAADVGAYFAGKAFGRHKLAPLVSPGKTWEGVAGGVVLAIVVAQVGAWLLRLPAVALAVVTLIIVPLSIVGDLTESWFKRHAGVKDSGQFLPGHGGLMDRLDGLVAALPIFVLALEAFRLWS